jgi:hypothetical protein
MRKSEWITGLAYLLVLAVLPVAGHWARSGAARTCAYDGGAIEPRYRVRIVDEHGRDVLFCCIHCAGAWSKRQETKPKAVWVTDETSGEEIEAESAFFVRSLVMTNPTTRDRIHAFRDESDAREHAERFHGQVLDAAERPFAECCCCPACPQCTKSANPR